MSPTSSSRLLVGLTALSATLRATSLPLRASSALPTAAKTRAQGASGSTGNRQPGVQEQPAAAPRLTRLPRLGESEAGREGARGHVVRGGGEVQAREADLREGPVGERPDRRGADAPAAGGGDEPEPDLRPAGRPRERVQPGGAREG